MIILATVAFGNDRSSSNGGAPPEPPSRSDIAIAKGDVSRNMRGN